MLAIIPGLLTAMAVYLGLAWLENVARARAGAEPGSETAIRVRQLDRFVAHPGAAGEPPGGVPIVHGQPVAATVPHARVASEFAAVDLIERAPAPMEVPLEPIALPPLAAPRSVAAQPREAALP